MTAWFHTMIETGKSRGLKQNSWLNNQIREMLHGNQDYAGLLR